MEITLNEIEGMEPRYRTKFINSLAGQKQVALIGTQSVDGINNLAIFNSICHIGANPSLLGFICRPDTIERDTLTNILQTQSYSINYIHTQDYMKAHQTSARYDTNTSEFEAVGFEKYYLDNYNIPFVKEAPIKILMKLEDKVDIKINGTCLVIGSIQHISLPQSILQTDGFIALDRAHILSCIGLDAYYETKPIGRLNYAKPNSKPTLLNKN